MSVVKFLELSAQSPQGYEDAIKQARLARILRDEDWCRETKTVKLWTPKENS